MSRFFRISLALALACVAACSEPLDGLDSASSQTVEQAIVNGTDEPLITNLTGGEQLAIVFLADSAGDPFCTGTVIADEVVLTALHCIEDREITDIRVGIGQPESPRLLVGLRRVSEADWESDIALLQLDRSAASAVAGLIPIPWNRTALDDSLVGTDVETAGYHAISGVSRRRFAVLEVTGVFETFTKADGFGARGACQGDSGGPLLLHDDFGEPVVAGTIIGGHTSCLQHTYFSRTDVLADWIDEEIDWFASDNGGTGGGSSQGNRRIPDPCACSPVRGVPDVWTSLLVVIIGLALVRRRVG